MPEGYSSVGFKDVEEGGCIRDHARGVWGVGTRTVLIPLTFKNHASYI